MCCNGVARNLNNVSTTLFHFLQRSSADYFLVTGSHILCTVPVRAYIFRLHIFEPVVTVIVEIVSKLAVSNRYNNIIAWLEVSV